MKRRLNETIEIGDEVYVPSDEYTGTVIEINGDEVLVDGPFGEEYHNLSDLEKLGGDYEYEMGESKGLSEARKKVIRLTESDLARIVKRVIKEQYHENIPPPTVKSIAPDFALDKVETPIDDDLRSKFDSYKRKMENFLRELKSSGTEIDKHRFLKQVQKETDQMFWDVYDNSDSEPEGFVELQMDLIKHFRKKLNESYRSRVVKENEDVDGLLRNIVRGFDTEKPKDFTEIISDISDLIDNSESANDFKMKYRQFTNRNKKDLIRLNDDEKNQLDSFINSVMTRHGFN
jgi:hypothetical protein